LKKLQDKPTHPDCLHKHSSSVPLIRRVYLGRFTGCRQTYSHSGLRAR
jgi:hypothetical protein